VQTTLVLIVVAAGVAFFLWKKKKKKFGGDEDRPEIIVRNGRLRIRTGKDWKRVGSDKKWKPDHPNGKSVKEYAVTVKNAKENACDNTTLTGRKVTITYKTDSGERKIELVRERDADTDEPVVVAEDNLEHDGGDRQVLKIKLDPEGGIIKVKVDGNDACTFPKDPNEPVVVKVDMKYH
jgi:hypothetical protein